MTPSLFRAFLLWGVNIFNALQAASQVTPGDFPVVINSTFPLKLAVNPLCGQLSSQNFTEINTGIIPLSATRTIVAFGDSWTSNGANGTVPVPPIMWPPSPSAGSRVNQNRRASNGFIWVEDWANMASAKLLNYAWGGAVIDNFAWNTTSPNNKTSVPRTDFVAEANLFFLQGKFLDSLVPSQTVYTVAFGINDEGQFELAGGDWNRAYNTYVRSWISDHFGPHRMLKQSSLFQVTKLGELQAFGAKNILIHGMYKSHPNTDILQNRVFAYLKESKAVNGTEFAFVNLETLFTAIADNPAAFGYRGNPTCLVSANTIVGGCNDPDHSVFWIRKLAYRLAVALD
ncbi:hypothetical protein D9758_009757 [Tetrapyrgos nigripes]|uniref:Uncharacterized protein n=1 Tax=Tetrapyrgos nigripes TaxID=182062 RepID=A0A8H5LQM1_9AGAR|nr:hypothetical protein D9758_009757 [Tetrapyrgos nigripes]